MKQVILLAATSVFVSTTLQAQTYSVQSGDTLMTIAEKIYGQTSRWRELCDENAISDCNRIEIGEVLQLAPDAQSATEGSEQAAVGQETADPALAPEGLSLETGGPIISFDLSVGSSVTLSEPEGLSVDRVAEGAVMSGQPVDEAPSTGRTGGINFATGGETENSVSDQTIQVEIDAAGNAPFSIAYSTNDVGNSGWRTFTATTTPQTFSFTYAVRPKNNGNNDFIGILPDTGSEGGNLVVTSVRIVLIEEQ